MSEAPYRPPSPRDYVPNDALRERFLKLGATPTEVAAAAGWYRSRNDHRPDDTRVRKALGLVEHHGRRNTRVPYLSAVALAQALELDPVDAGV